PRAGADREHRDHRTDAEDHPEHRQERAQLVAPQAAEALAEDLEAALELHPTPSATGTFAALRAGAPSRTIRPSCISTTRGSSPAISGLCVTITIVRPWRWSERKSSITSAPFFESRLPVGSSARSSAGRLTSARAIA